MKMQVPEELDKMLRQIGVGARSIDDPFFDETYKAFGVFTSLGIYHADDEELCHPEMKEFSCNAPNCTATFKTLVEFEMHYNGCHIFTCLECKKIRPTERLLDIHIQETHDSFFQVLVEKKPMYQCFVSDCMEKFSSPTERREHSIKIHKFPKNYRYDESLKKSTKKDREKSKKEDKMQEGDMKNEQLDATGDAMEVDPPKTIAKIPKKPKPNIYKNQKSRTFIPSMKNATAKPPDNTNSPPTAFEIRTNEVKPISAALAFIPRQLMQKSYSKVLTKDKKMERNVLDSENMMDLAEALPE